LSLKVPKVVSDLKSLSVAVFRATQLLPKHMRPKVGGRIEDHCLDAWLLGRQFALTAKDEKPASRQLLLESLSHLDRMGCLFELCLELRAISDGNFGEIIQQTAVIQKQLHGLLKTYAESN